MITCLAAAAGGPETQLIIGIVLTAVASFFGRSWFTERAARRKLTAEAAKTGIDAEHSQAQTVRELLEGAEAIASWRKEALELANRRIDALESAAEIDRQRLADCERHTQTIDDLRAQMVELHERFDSERALAERYLRERNEARDELKEVRVQLARSNERITSLEERLDNR